MWMICLAIVHGITPLTEAKRININSQFWLVSTWLRSPFEGNMLNSERPKPRWQELNEAASAETNREKLTDLISRVEEALMIPAGEISHGPDHSEERNAMVQASENIL